MTLYAFDGTWNDSNASDDRRDTNKDTNVHRFRAHYGKPEDVHYVDGVGTRFGRIGKWVGGLTGAGAEKRLSEQFEVLTRNFEKGDCTIDIVGYSRGATISRMFVHRIARDFDLLKVNGRPLENPPTVRFLGLFDTVASFGVPWTENEHDFESAVPEFVEHTFHAMALDETRETFGIERCVGNLNQITEVWFRGGHGDIGGNATYVSKQSEKSNRERSDIALNWMLSRANACGLPVLAHVDAASVEKVSTDAPVTAKDELVSIGKAGTLSRRIHIGDLVHHTVERTDLTRGIDGRLLRRIDVLTRIEDEILELRSDSLNWAPPAEVSAGPDNVRVSESAPSLSRLSLRRYPFDVLPARTWSAWLKIWNIGDADFESDRLDEFWAPNDADRALAWDIYVEIKTRIASQDLADDEGDDVAALKSVYTLFPLSREAMRSHGVKCENTGALLTMYLNRKVRHFSARWHKRSVDEQWKDNPQVDRPEFRDELRALQPTLQELAAALSHVADARL